jgi:hypothetical protein
MKSATLGQLVKDHQKANDRVTYFCNLKGELTESQQEASVDALHVLSRTWSAVCRFKARDADELLKWLAYVLEGDEVTGKSIRVMDGVAALKAAHGALCEHLLPTDPFHTR